MHTDIHERNTQPRTAQLVVGVLMFLTTLALVAALAQSSSAQAGSSAPDDAPSNGKSNAAAPLAGERIAFVSRRDGQPSSVADIYTMLPDGSDVRRVTNNNQFNYRPVFSPDGSRIAFFSDIDGHLRICLINTDGTHFVQLQQYTAHRVSWSPDSQKILYSGDQYGEIHIMNADGTGDVALTTDGTGSYSPAFSPDGTLIAYSNTARDGDIDDREIYVMNADGSNSHQITEPGPTYGVYDDEADWSPDGTKIAFTRNTNGSSVNIQVFIMDPDGGNQTPLTDIDGNDILPTWSPDGLQIAYEH